ncbi:hypothetical protein CS063_04585 [Sporanaerobium hydrogeniformans]|uniref:Uncharacterized protein n=1 Tax=Sporanaerobium hydrogeniformans TaxID=3072179 RepID=A0AC61DI11_9FIRM|nr:response regulator [Sporanaerobium hydrogeniformans]PHV71837.1 hypothetical protein CS063_04585 [Sporanaerobium hydrogeniformans]
MKLIIVDDEILVRKGIIMTVDWDGLGINEVIEAGNGEQALSLIREKEIDIVITDIKMPKMDGLTLIERLKECRPGAVVIVLSCVNDMDSVRKALKFGGALDYIPKLSMSTDELVETLKKAISYVDKSKNYVTKDLKEILPSFFTSSQDEQLRKAIEYGEKEDIDKLFQEILCGAYVLRGKWKESREWEDLIGVFSSLIKRYNIDVNQFFSKFKCIKEVTENETSLEEMVNYLKNIAYCVKETIEQEKKESYDENIYKAIGYIKERYDQNIRSKEVASYINMSEGYFSKYFKKIIGVNFTDYVNHIKIEKAKELLIRKKLTIQEVSEKIGYTNCSYFSQIFKEIEGVTPKQYQKANNTVKNT